jgi:uncharacterized membrane protein YkvA (DUF1232 family)
MAVSVAAYALSPIDLIPDFVPVLGYLDDVVIVPAGILLTVRLIPTGLMEEFRAEAGRRVNRPTSRAGAAAIVLLWIAVLALTVWWLTSRASRSPQGVPAPSRSPLAARQCDRDLPCGARKGRAQEHPTEISKPLSRVSASVLTDTAPRR